MNNNLEKFSEEEENEDEFSNDLDSLELDE